MRTSLAGKLNAFVDPDIAQGMRPFPDNPLTSLAGVPIGIKDNIDVAGLPTTAGTPILAGSIARSSATVVKRLTAAGALVAGKTNMHELALGISSNNHFLGSVKNPHDLSRSAGGSSGGSAALVAAGLLPIALGTDTAGSVRIPASFCGCVGFRPSTGRYPMDGILPLVRSRDAVGILARNVAEVGLVDRVIQSTGPGAPGERRLPARLGVATDFRTRVLDDDISAMFKNSLKRLANSGVELVELVDEALYAKIGELAVPLTAYEIKRDLFAAVRSRTSGMSMTDFLDSISSPDVASQVRELLQSDATPSTRVYENLLRQRIPEFRDRIHESMDRAHVDAVIFPTTPTVAFSLRDEDTIAIAGSSYPRVLTTIRNMQTATLAGLPSISLPVTQDGIELPGGLTLEARAGQDNLLLQMAAAVEDIIA